MGSKIPGPRTYISPMDDTRLGAQGSYGRQTGEVFPGKIEAVYGNSVWAMVRTVRLESPRLHISSVDVPTGATAWEIAECLRAAQLDSGNRMEISYIVDRKNKLKK